MCQKVKFT